VGSLEHIEGKRWHRTATLGQILRQESYGGDQIIEGMLAPYCHEPNYQEFSMMEYQQR